MREWSRDGVFSYARTWSTPWDARDMCRTEVLFIHHNRKRLLALVTPVPEYLTPKQVARGEHLVCPSGTDTGNTADVEYTSENASRKIKRGTAINKEDKSDPLHCQESSQHMPGQLNKDELKSAPTPTADT